MQIEEAPLCTDGDPMPGSACGGEGREGGREERRVLMKGGEEREGRGVSGTECHHCVWWGEGARKKENQARVLVLPGSYREDGVIRVDSETGDLMVGSRVEPHCLTNRSESNIICR